MDSQARVGSLDVVIDFRAAYAKFGDAARQALLGTDLEIRRMLDWLEKDQVAFWKGEIRRLEEKVNEAKGALHRKRITATFGNVAADTDEQIQLRKAKDRLARAEEKLKTVKQWHAIVEQEVVEYRGPSQQLANLLDADVPRALAMLDRTVQTLESYLAVALPGSEPAPGIAAGAAEGAPAPPPPTSPKAAARAAAAFANEGTEPARPADAMKDSEGST